MKVPRAPGATTRICTWYGDVMPWIGDGMPVTNMVSVPVPVNEATGVSGSAGTWAPARSLMVKATTGALPAVVFVTPVMAKATVGAPGRRSGRTWAVRMPAGEPSSVPVSWWQFAQSASVAGPPGWAIW